MPIWMRLDAEGIGRALNRFKRNNVQIVYGPGRHPPSGSIFLHFLDPDEITLEYSFGMEEFPEADAREPRVLLPVPESIDTWGSARDLRFATVREIGGRPDWSNQLVISPEARKAGAFLCRFPALRAMS